MMGATRSGEAASEGHSDDLSAIRAANLQLQTTIDKLRTELEACVAEGVAAVQQVRAEQAGHIYELQDTIRALRRELETARQDALDAAGRLTSAFAQERDNLHGQIVALRQQLEARQQPEARA